MKRILLFAFLITIAFPSYSQSIAYREEKDGIVTTATSRMTTRAFSHERIGIALYIASDQTTNVKSVLLDFLYELDKTYTQKGSRAIIKTFTGDIIKLVQNTNDDTVSKYREQSDETLDLYFINVQYLTDEKTLNKLINEGIQKIRIETLTGLRDYVFKNDVLGGYLKSEHNLIIQNNDFSANF